MQRGGTWLHAVLLVRMADSEGAWYQQSHPGCPELHTKGHVACRRDKIAKMARDMVKGSTQMDM